MKLIRNLIVAVLLIIALKGSSQGSIIIQNGTTIKFSSGVMLNVRDMDLINDGELNSANGDGRIIFSGSNNNKIGGSGITSLDELEIAKNINSTLSLDQDLQIRSAIWFNGGLINLNNRNIILLGNAALQNESANSRLTGLNGGFVQLSMQLNNPQALNPGNLGAVLTSSQNMGLTTIRRGHTVQNLGNGKQSILRYYDIQPANNSSLNATLRVNYLDAELNNQNEALLSLWKSADNVNWANQGFTSRNTSTNYVEKQSISSFSRWSLSSDATALPVNDLTLWGVWKNNVSALSWTTGSEHNNSHFEVERKYANENNFTTVGKVNTLRPGGNSSSIATYYFNDPAATNQGMISYRLKQVDVDRQFAYSKTILIKPEAQHVFIQNLYPTSLTGQSIYVRTGDLNLKEMNITLYDAQGRVFMKTKKSYTSQWMDLPALSTGMYELKIETGTWRFTGRFVKQ